MVRLDTPTGTASVSTPALTALDLVNRPDDGGTSTTWPPPLIDLARDARLDDAELASLSPKFPVAASWRVGWIVRRHSDAGSMHSRRPPASRRDEPSKLDQHSPRFGGHSPRFGAFDRRWRRPMSMHRYRPGRPSRGNQ